MASGGGDQPSTAETPSQAKAKLKRRRVKREGPPTLQFLVATDPSQFRGEDAKRSVRSQAMIHWRHEEDKKKRKASLKDVLTSNLKNASGETDAQTSTLPKGTRTYQSVPVSSSSGPNITDDRPSLSNTDPEPCDASLGSSSYVGTGSSSWQLTAPETSMYFPQYHNNLRTTEDTRIVDYEESEDHAERLIRTIVVRLATFYNIGGGYDPFDVLPQFRNPNLNSLLLTRQCMRGFATSSTMAKWLPIMLSHPHIILSSTVLASTYVDMHNQWSGDSTTTAMVKAETIDMINERFRSPALQLDDTTLIVILHLFAGEMWLCNEKHLRGHENGIASFIARRGGLSSFVQNSVLAEVAVACCFHCDIFCEAETLTGFQDWLPTSFGPIDDKSALPESPLYCPRPTFVTVAKGAYCSPTTLNLLSDMRDLTTVFVAHSTALNTIHDADIVDLEDLSAPVDHYEATIEEIRTRVAALPSAHAPGLLVSGDWVYEACRIAALIYTTAISMKVPFSVAADPNYINLLGAPTSFIHHDSDGHAYSAHLTEALHEALQRTDTNDIWKEMSGVLYWVSAVGAAAARTSNTMDMSQQNGPGYNAYSKWVRRCLIMTATRTMIILVFEHATAIITAQKTLLKVQELIGSHSSRRLMS